jgi:hypothetical protein
LTPGFAVEVKAEVALPEAPTLAARSCRVPI